MFTRFFILGLMMTCLWQNAPAQIVSQTPRPEIIAPDPGKTELLKPNTTIGQSDNFIRIPRTGAFLFASFDSNHDYIIDSAEVQSGIQSAFAYADRDKSGILSLVELEGWRVAALGYENATPTNFAFAPNFARTVSRETFAAVLTSLAENLDKDAEGHLDGTIATVDLLKNYTPRRTKQKGADNCLGRLQKVRREMEQQCRARRGY